MTKFWLLVFLFNVETKDFIRRNNIPFDTQARCEAIAKDIPSVYKGYRTVAFCVSDDHFKGRKLDPGIPSDFELVD